MDQVGPGRRAGRCRAVRRARGVVSSGALLVMLLGSVQLGGSVRANAAEPFYLAPGDRLSITVFDQPDISGSYMVDAGGEVTLPLIGSVPVTRLTPSDLQGTLIARFGDGYLQNPVVNVRLAELRPVTIVGDVRGSGRYAFVDGLTVEAAMALAGGSVRVTNEESVQRLELLRTRERLNGLTVAELSQRVRRARLEAQSRDETDFKDPPAGPGEADLLARIAAGEHQILTYDAAALASQIALLNERIHILESDVQGGTEQAALEKDQIANLEDQLTDGKGLLASGLTRKPMVLDLQREISKTQSNLLRITSELARSKSSLAETRLKIGDLVTASHDRIAADLQAVVLRIEDIATALPLAREDLRLRLEQLPFATKADGKPVVVRLTRYSDGAIKTVVAEPGTLLRPGDILQVGDGSGAAGSNSARTGSPVSDLQPEPGGMDGRSGTDRPGDPAALGNRLSQR